MAPTWVPAPTVSARVAGPVELGGASVPLGPSGGGDVGGAGRAPAFGGGVGGDVRGGGAVGGEVRGDGAVGGAVRDGGGAVGGAVRGTAMRPIETPPVDGATSGFDSIAAVVDDGAGGGGTVAEEGAGDGTGDGADDEAGDGAGDVVGDRADDGADDGAEDGANVDDFAGGDAGDPAGDAADGDGVPIDDRAGDAVGGRDTDFSDDDVVAGGLAGGAVLEAPVAFSAAFTFDKIDGICGADTSAFFGGGLGGPRRAGADGVSVASSAASAGCVRARRVGESAFLISARFERSGAKSEPLSTSMGMSSSIERSAIAAAAAAASASTSTCTSGVEDAGSLSMRMIANAASTSASSIGVSCGGVATRFFGRAGFCVFWRVTRSPRASPRRR